ncbi:FAD-dependent oxidoreductase [Paraconexibacter sp.]|uniref:glycerol-3-phosphate dehydrogenase/oxidase n=1 Tax=Paraconexibacter sp. TaxID=2949640 RepID=UPI003565F925
MTTAELSPDLNAARRERDLHLLASGHEVDVLVVGGGITGAGVALDAVTRGLSVALVERRDLANGTSRWSTKLVHGGLRYLAKGDVGVAWESATERARIVETIAPHLVRALPFTVPLTPDLPPVSAGLTATGLRLGDAMRAAAGTSGKSLPRTRRITAAEALRWTPALRQDGLRGAYLHWDAALEDDARLVVAVARTAAAHGARILTYSEVEEITSTGARVRDVRSGQTFDLRARHVINAAGVWSAALHPGIALRPSAGAHLLLDAATLGDPAASMTVPIPGEFGRFVFLHPRPDGLVLLGLTDEPYDGATIPDEPQVTQRDEAFLLETVSRALARPLTPQDVVGRYAGLRPLLDAGDGSTADVSRRHAVLVDEASSLVTVVGGKLTTYRRMAQDAVDVVAARPGVAAGPCVTTRTPVVGAPGASGPAGAGDAEVPARLTRRFGAEAPRVAALADGRPELLRPLHPDVPVTGVEVLFAARAEGAIALEDVLDRRTRTGLVPAWREALATPAAELLGEIFTTTTRSAA